MQKMFSHHTSAFRHTPAASASDDEDVNSSSSSEGPGRENEASHTKTTFSFRRTASINTFWRGLSSIFVSGEDVLSSDREDRGRVDYNPISAKKGAAGHPRLTVISTMFTRPKNPPLSSCELWFYPCPWTTWKEDSVICWLYFVSSMDAPLELVLPSSSSEYSWRSRRRRHSLKNVPDNLFKVSVSSASSSCIGVCCCSFPWRSLLS